MGKLIKFPAHRVVYNNDPIRPELSEEEARQIKEDKFVEQITESLILDIIHVLQENAVETTILSLLAKVNAYQSFNGQWSYALSNTNK